MFLLLCMGSFPNWCVVDEFEIHCETFTFLVINSSRLFSNLFGFSILAKVRGYSHKFSLLGLEFSIRII